MAKWVFAVLILLGLASARAEGDEDALDLFKTKIAPILQSPNPSSCAECHLSGVDLKDYIGETHEKTFASLRSAGLIDIDNPDRSKVLEFIRRAPQKPSPLGSKARQVEYDAFQAWIRAAVKDPQLATAKTDGNQLGPRVPLDVIRHSRQDRVLRSFVENIWSEMGRCVSCHSPELNRNKIGRNGKTKEDIDAISWVVPRDPAATLQQLVDSGNIDTDDPDSSQVLTKPVGLEEHGGGPKFAVGSQSDKNFRRFLRDYAAIVNGRYRTADQLPEESKDVAVLTGQHLRIVDLPEAFGGQLLRADIYRRMDDGWSETPWGTAENPIAGKRRMWQSMVFAVALRGSARAKQLQPERLIPGGRYLIKIYIDRHGKTKTDRDYVLGEPEYYGQVETQGPWEPGYQPPKIVHAPSRD